MYFVKVIDPWTRGNAFTSKQILFFTKNTKLEFMKMIMKQVHQNIMKVMLQSCAK